jgi:histone demethylase JARID1
LCQAEQLTLQLPPASHAASASSSLLPSRPASSLTAAADASEWNLNGIARLPSGFLQHTHQSIPGVTAPMLCEWLLSARSSRSAYLPTLVLICSLAADIGMRNSTFCWHNEDNWLYSTSYMHAGEPKIWSVFPSCLAFSLPA